MKRLKNVATLLITILLSLTSCDKVDKNGDLDGMWQCQNYSDITENGKPYLSVQLDLLNIRYADYNIYARFEHNGNTLRIYNAYSRSGRKRTDFQKILGFAIHSVIKIQNLFSKMLIYCKFYLFLRIYNKG